MPFERVRFYVKQFYPEIEPISFAGRDTSTVETAAAALGVEPAMIAKSILFKCKENFALFVLAGDVRVNPKIVKKIMGGQVRMARPDEVEAVTGFRIGGVCPFALRQKIDIYLDTSMRRFQLVYPASGDDSSALPVTFAQLLHMTDGLEIDPVNFSEETS
jgi:prolyl-tRNA editing enzyme YbaK/EbsC (Cys-tRNA(Pro) deacylase)